MLGRFARGLLSKKCRRLNGPRLQIFLRPIIADNAFKKCCASFNYFHPSDSFSVQYINNVS